MKQDAQQPSFEAFFQSFERRIFGYLWHLTGDENAAYDLSQETFLRAWTHFDEIRTHRDSGAWLFRVASNLAMSYLRRTAHPVGSAQPIDDFDPASSDPSRRFVESDMIRQILDGLSPRQRAVLILREIYGMSGDEIAQMLELSLEAVKIALWRARCTFRDRYKEENR